MDHLRSDAKKWLETRYAKLIGCWQQAPFAMGIYTALVFAIAFAIGKVA